MDKLILHILNNVGKFVAFNDPLGFPFRTWLDYPEHCFVFMPTLTIGPSAIMCVASAEEFEWSVILLAYLSAHSLQWFSSSCLAAVFTKRKKYQLEVVTWYLTIKTYIW